MPSTIIPTCAGWMDGGLELNFRAQGVTDDEEMRWIW